MAREELTLDAETSKAMEAMRKDEPIETAPEINEDGGVTEKDSHETETTEEKPGEKPEGKEKNRKTVPITALHEAREELKRERESAKEQLRKYEERMEQLVAKLAPTKEPEAKEEPVDIDRDPIAALKATQKQLADLMEERKVQGNIQQEEVRRQQVMRQAANFENEFIKTAPDYQDASQFLIKSRTDELLATGLYDEQSAKNILKQETLALAQMALQNGKNPAEIAYKIAKSRGYTGKKSEGESLDKEAERIERISQGQQASKSIGQGGGGNVMSGSKMDGKTLANMSDDDFAKVTKSMSRNELKALMGG